MSKLSSSLILNKYILNLFGVTDLEALSTDLKDSALEGYDENNVSHFHHALVNRFYSNTNLPKEILYQYDQNIYSHSKTINEKRDLPLKWKYFQYLALLFTEIYLDKYFADPIALKSDLNQFLEESLDLNKFDFKAITEYKLSETETDLNKLAYWNATGSGKTLLMHMNILQYQYYLAKHNKLNSLNRIIVLTPNEGLSKQHLKEFAASGLQAELFDKNAGSLFVGQKIEIIDIHKLEEKSGDKTVAVEAFEGNNLVLVDEGHRGAGGDVWKDKRMRLSETGFSFEYSATFGQSVSAVAGGKQKLLVDEYGKATIFDYSYKYFYNDGYGKDYQILNLDQKWDENYVELYLTACLLSFYEQLLVYKDNRLEIAAFLIDKPLAIFVGGKVTKSISKEIASDVVEVLKFFERFVKNNVQSVEFIQRVLDDKTGLNNEFGQSIFRNSFKEVRKSKRTAARIYEDVLLEVFNSKMAGAFLHLDNLKGQGGEIGLRIGNEPYFGVINVGDDAGLLKICETHKLSTSESDFSDSLFHKINSKDSKINILIGSKKFTEGWSSWRVSTMGLLNIGRGEGSEIIQLFGRGVRLKGYDFSLKRSASLDYSMKPAVIPPTLPILETLNIFGVRADYMQQFKEYLEEEGLPTDSDFERISLEILPAISNLSEKKLKYIRVKEGANFKKEVIVDAVLKAKTPSVILDWYPKVQVLHSARNTVQSTIIATEQGKLRDYHLAFLNWTDIYFEIEKFKNERSWYNLNLSRDELKTILYNPDWYTLSIPLVELELKNYSQVKNWHEIAVALLKSFVERIYNHEKNKYYSNNIEVAILDSSHPNFEEEYNFLVKKSEDRIIEKISELKEVIKKKEFKQNFQIGSDFEALYSDLHLYFPLVYFDKSRYEEVVKLQPTQLNKGERDLVEDLKLFYERDYAFVGKKEVFLLRNTSRKGIGFFEANNFYPDFILWIVDGDKQYVSFLDPKGLRQIQGFEDPKIDLHRIIKTTIQAKLNDSNIELNSFIISNTAFEQLNHWKGQDSVSDFNKHNVVFQKDQKENYIKIIFDKMLK